MIPPGYKNIAYLSDIEFTIFAYFAYKYTHSSAKEKKNYEKTGVTVSYKELNRLYISTPHLATVLKSLQDNKLINKSTLSEDKRKTNYILPYSELKKFNEINIKALQFCNFNETDTYIINNLIKGTIALLKSNKIINEEQEKNLDEFLNKSDNYFKFYYVALALWTSRYLITSFQIKLMGPSEFMVYALIIKFYIKNDKKPITTKKVKEETGLAPSIISQSFKKFIDEDIITRKEINKFKVYFYINKKNLEKRLMNDTVIIDEITKNFKNEDEKKFEKFVDKLSTTLTDKLNSLEVNKVCLNKKCGMEIPLMPGLKYCPYCGEKVA
jgi:DNA-binding MarR family transcriptional regulator